MLNKRTIKEYFMITVGTALISAAVYFFMIPANLCPGSAAALTLRQTIISVSPVQERTMDTLIRLFSSSLHSICHILQFLIIQSLTAGQMDLQHTVTTIL